MFIYILLNAYISFVCPPTVRKSPSIYVDEITYGNLEYKRELHKECTTELARVETVADLWSQGSSGAQWSI